MNSAAYDYSFSPMSGNQQGFYWQYAQQRNTMSTELDAIETDLMAAIAESRLYDFTKTVNMLPREHAAMINRTILEKIAENIQRMNVSRDAKIAVMNILTSKFGPAT
jgi:uncharacterized protein with ACT and thioredoxin-like domain